MIWFDLLPILVMAFFAWLWLVAVDREEDLTDEKKYEAGCAKFWKTQHGDLLKKYLYLEQQYLESQSNLGTCEYQRDRMFEKIKGIVDAEILF